MIDLSSVTALAPLSDVVRDVVQAGDRAEAEIFIAGAFGRDLWLRFAYEVAIVRATEDIDFAVECESWETFERVATALIASGFLAPGPRRPHRFFHTGGTPIDLVPFGGIERPGNTIAWPPDESHVMNLLGFAEAFRSTVTFRLPGGVEVPVASLASLAMLKLIAWRDRRFLEPGKDAKDLHLILKNYFDAGNRDRLFVEIPDLEGRANFDLELAGAELLGRDLSQLISDDLRAELVRVLEEESSSQGDLQLASDMRRDDAESARKLLSACVAGLRATGPS